MEDAVAAENMPYVIRDNDAYRGISVRKKTWICAIKPGPRKTMFRKLNNRGWFLALWKALAKNLVAI